MPSVINEYIYPLHVIHEPVLVVYEVMRPYLTSVSCKVSFDDYPDNYHLITIKTPAESYTISGGLMGTIAAAPFVEDMRLTTTGILTLKWNRYPGEHYLSCNYDFDELPLRALPLYGYNYDFDVSPTKTSWQTEGF